MNKRQSLKSLHLPVKGEYFNQYLAGEKPLEYRKITDRWTKILCNPDGSFKQFKDVHYKLGYPKAGDASKIVIIPFIGIHIVKGLIHPHFDNVPTDVYAIGLDDITNRLNKPDGQGE